MYLTLVIAILEFRQRGFHRFLRHYKSVTTPHQLHILLAVFLIQARQSE